MSERKCPCGKDGESSNLNGYREYLCNSHYNEWVEANREFQREETKRYQEKLFKFGRDWHWDRFKHMEV